MGAEHMHVLTGSTSGASNLDCILQYTTPSVQCQYPPKSSLFVSGCDERCRTHCSESMPFFYLGDLWRSFDEWSAYGAGVPLRLPSGENIVQYYVPYLSALQIYLQPGSSFFSNKRRLGDNSDWSDGSDTRDASSDCGSDNENEKMLSRLQIKTADQWDITSSVPLGRLSSASCEQADWLGELVFEYFERCSPYGRAPLAGKIGGLATRFPHLLSLRSSDVSPASWVSVAWYPIYRIPTGPTMSDLSTCFLSFHSLWTPPLLLDVAGECKAGPVYGDACSCKVEQEQWLREHSAWRVTSRTVELPAFGLASYKLGGPFWASAAPTDKLRVLSLATSAGFWLKQLGVQHPDFNFFISREGLCEERF